MLNFKNSFCLWILFFYLDFNNQNNNYKKGKWKILINWAHFKCDKEINC